MGCQVWRLVRGHGRRKGEIRDRKVSSRNVTNDWKKNLAVCLFILLSDTFNLTEPDFVSPLSPLSYGFTFAVE